MPWEPPEIETDEDAVTDRILDGMAEKMSGWTPVEGAPEVALGEEIGREIAVLNQKQVLYQELAIAGMGETAFGFPAYLGVAAEIQVQLTVTAEGDTVPQGFTVVGINADSVEVAFELLEDVTVADGTTVTVTMTATDPGDYANTVPAGALTIVLATATVVTAVALSPSTGGADAETLQDYLGRLTDYFATLRPGGVRAVDLAALARSVPGVSRALGVDLYDPAHPETPAERTATVFPIDENGDPVSEEIADQVQTVLEASREVNFIIHVAEPTYTAVAIEYAAVAETGADPAVVATAIETAVLDWLTSWGTTEDDDTAWEPVTVVRRLQLAKIAGSAPGVAYLESITINGSTADVTLPGVAPLPASPSDPVDPSTVTGTVT